MGLIEKVQPPTATLNGPSGKSLPATSSSTDLDPASKWRRFVSKTSSKMEPEQTPFSPLNQEKHASKFPTQSLNGIRKLGTPSFSDNSYEEPPAKGAVHAIVNGIGADKSATSLFRKWMDTLFYLESPVQMLEGNSQSMPLAVEGQTMFVAKWAPGPLQEKPELSMVPVWLDFTGVPLQFFNRDALKEIAGLVGHPICLHSATENLTNLEVARVYTVIDPRKPLPEGVNAQFESGGLIVDLSPHFVPSSAAPSEDESYSSQQGKIWVVWHPSVQVTLISKSLQVITCAVKLPFQPSEMVISIVYGSNFREDRRSLWSELISTSSTTKHSAGNDYLSTSGMREFNDCVNACLLSDLPYFGNTHTWSNSQGSTLDSVGVFGDPGISDHSPCCIYMDSFSPKQKKPSSSSQCSTATQSLQRSYISVGTLSPFSGSRITPILPTRPPCFSISISSSLERTAHRKWIMLAKAEESFLRQRARIQWLAEGDCNSAFFYRAIKSRSAQNFIHMLLDSSDRVIDDLQGIKDHILGFYQNLLGGQIQPTSSSPDLIGDLVPYRCSSEASATLLARSPGPDGYPAEFFTANWNAVGADMVAAVQEFFESGKILRQWNSTAVTLIRKKPNASKITEFRPISCCNTVYKVISKLLANRLKQILPSIISNSQSAFIPGRSLAENALNFPRSFTNLIKQCLTTTSFSIAINGELCGYFKGTRGLRQGDPLSPYLFVLVMEVFCCMLNGSYSAGLIGYHPKAEHPQVVWPFYESLQTDLFTGGLNLDETNDLASLGFNLGSFPIRYLGLPLMHRKLRIVDYRPLLDRLRSYFTSWTSRALSYAGRLQMLKSVIYGLLNFGFTAFILPKGCIAQISLSALASSGQEISESLWASWTKENRIQDKVFWEIEPADHFSWTWKTILALRHEASSLLKCRLGNGKQASFWHDSWTPFGPLVKYIGQQGPRELGIPSDASIASVLTHEGWNMRHARSDRAMVLQIHLSSVRIPQLSDPDDEYYWCVNDVELDKFSTKHTWEFLRPRGPVQDWTATVWFKGSVPRHAFHFWVTQLDRLPTRTRLASWGLPIDQSCCLCGNALENRDHLFLRCEVSQYLWSMITRRLGFRTFTFHTWTAFIAWLGSNHSSHSTTLRRIAAQATIYILWYERNNRLHNSISSSPAVLFNCLTDSSKTPFSLVET
ncbi:uncharacterized protein LOC125594173 [Brassica napus]|uniref:uncharacterized protein LOC125594173 n=1 Tax=Brassica napus TaxID=3708 RepID=UPI002078DE58|nr:uncharacterized protein LOC125594173 [Brassica napus]